MRRKILFRVGRILDTIGRKLEYWPSRLQSYGMNLWDANCTCEKCTERAITAAFRKVEREG